MGGAKEGVREVLFWVYYARPPFTDVPCREDLIKAILEYPSSLGKDSPRPSGASDTN
mgnify:CR=1 FL=1